MRHLRHGRTAGHRQRTAALQEGAYPLRRNAAYILEHPGILVKVTCRHTHTIDMQRGRQLRLQGGQSPHGPAKLPGAGQYALRLGRQRHACRVQMNEALFLQESGH